MDWCSFAYGMRSSLGQPAYREGAAPETCQGAPGRAGGQRRRCHHLQLRGGRHWRAVDAMPPFNSAVTNRAIDCLVPKPIASYFVASRWIRWSRAMVTVWRWRTTEACTCGAARLWLAGLGSLGWGPSVHDAERAVRVPMLQHLWARLGMSCKMS
jgi:hypothetical protein